MNKKKGEIHLFQVVVAIALFLSIFVVARYILAVTLFKDEYLNDYSSLLSEEQFMYDIMDEFNKKIDYRHPLIKELVDDITDYDYKLYNLYQVADIHNYLVRNWNYEDDPLGQEIFYKASETINKGLRGDCDDFAILLAACIQFIGGDARIVLTGRDNSDGHAYVELLIGNKIERIASINKSYIDYFRIEDSTNLVLNYRQDDDGSIWLNLDWSSSIPGGSYVDFDREWLFYLSFDQVVYREKKD